MLQRIKICRASHRSVIDCH